MNASFSELQEMLRRQIEWLGHSLDMAGRLPELESAWGISEYDAAEVLCARFARGSDFLIRKVFRTLAEAEFEPQGSLLDAVHFAHKRRLFEEMEEIRKIRDLRNRIAHDYSFEMLSEIFPEVLRLAPDLRAMMQKSRDYIESHASDL